MSPNFECEQCLSKKDQVEMLTLKVKEKVNPCRLELVNKENSNCKEYKPNFVTKFDQAVMRGRAGN